MSTKSSILVLIMLLLTAAGHTQLAAENPMPGGITFLPVTYSQWQEKLAAYKGNILVVDLWATWCAPCVQRFPHMVELSRKYSDRERIRFVSMSLDDRSDPAALELAHKFLIRQNATFDNYRMDEIIPDAFDKFNIQGIPAVFIYDRTGKLRYRLTGDDPNHQFTNEDVERAVKTLLLEGSRSPDQPLRSRHQGS